MIINHNIAALNTHRQLGANNAQASKNLEKLSSGLKINRAGDDAAGLAISEKMRGQIRGLDMAAKNSQDGISLIQTAEGALNETHSILQRMRELAVQAGNDTNVDSDRNEIQKEINQLTSEINRIGNTTEFNTKKLTNGELSSTAVKTPAVPGTVIDSVKATTQDVAVGANPVTWSGAGAEAKTDIKFTGTADNGFDWADIDSAETNELKLTKTDGEITVSFAGQDTAGATLTINAEALAFDAKTETYSYSNHGVSFSLSKEQVDGWTEGASATIDLNVAGSDLTAAAVNTDSGIQPLASTVATAGTDTPAAITGFKVDGDSNQLLNGASQVEVSWDGADLTVKLQDSVGGDVSTTKFSWDGTAAFDYKANGIEFKLEAHDATAITASTFKLKTEATKVEVGGTAAVTEDKSAQFQIGANENQSMSVGINDMRAAALGISGSGEGFTSAKDVTDGTNSTAVESAVDVSSHASAAKAVTTINKAIEAVSAERSKLGAVQNRLEHTINNLGASSENLTAAESRIRDVDYVLSAA